MVSPWSLNPELTTRRIGRWGMLAAAAVAGLALLDAGAAALRLTSPLLRPGIALALCAAAAAVLLQAPAAEAKPRPAWRRWLALAAGVVVFWVGMANWIRRPLAGVTTAPATALCLVLLAFTLIAAPFLPKMSIGADLLVVFVSLGVVLKRTFGVPMGGPGTHPTPATAGLLGLSLAWLACNPQQRPVAYFFEAGSAAYIMRRILPIALLFPLALVGVAVFQQDANHTIAMVSALLFEAGVAGFAVALMWLIARSLDRMDELRTTADAELRNSEERYRLLFESSPQPMWIYDAASLRFLAVNDSACAAYGYSRPEFLNMSLLDLCPPQAEPVDLESKFWRHRRRSGEAREVEAFTHEIVWQGRRAQISYLNDITARRRSEQQLRESEAQVRLLLESTTEGILGVDSQGNCVWCNPAAVRILGHRSSADLLGKNAHLLAHRFHPDGSPYPVEECLLMSTMREGKTLVSHEDVFWRDDGTSFPVECYAAPTIRNGQLVGAVVSFNDISERKNLQAQFHQSQKMEAVGRLAAGIAHDFNNLLTVINGYAEMLLRQPLAAAVAAKVDNIHKAGGRAATLTQQLLAFSRQQVLQPKIVNLNEVLAEADPLLRRVLGEDLIFSTDLTPDLAPVRADPGQIIQVLMNLTVNARDAMPQGGCLTIESANVTLDASYAATHPEAVPGHYVMLAVTDNGCGMDAITLSRAFDPFFTTKPVGQGTGLGLATVFGIVKQSGGSITIYSEPGRGTSVKIYLPSVGAIDTAKPEPEAAGTGAGGRGRVLVVEDELIVRELLQEILTNQGYTVLAAADPQQALALSAAETSPIDLLITDVVMPGMDGRRLAGEILRQRPQLAVLYISGYPQHALSHNGDLEPGLAFIQKPFTPDALAAKLQVLLRTRNAAGA